MLLGVDMIHENKVSCALARVSGDIANLNSVLAIRTQDLGTVMDEHHFHLLGREQNAAARGCSRASDAFFQAL